MQRLAEAENRNLIAEPSIIDGGVESCRRKTKSPSRAIHSSTLLAFLQDPTHGSLGLLCSRRSASLSFLAPIVGRKAH